MQCHRFETRTCYDARTGQTRSYEVSVSACPDCGPIPHDVMQLLCDMHHAERVVNKIISTLR